MRLPLEEIQLHFLDDPEIFAAFAAWEPEGTVACDIETTGLQPYGSKRDRIRLVQFGDENTGWAIPYTRDTRTCIQDALIVFAGRLVGHNSRFDEAFLKQAGFDTGPQWDDTYILHHLTHPLDYHGLKSVAGQLYGPGARAGEKWLDQVKRKNRWDWSTVPVDHPAYWGYAAFDCCLTARIWNDMEHLLGQGKPNDRGVREQYDRELRVARLMAEVAERGIPVDMACARGLIEKWADEASEIEDKLRAHQIEKPGSSAQIAAALMNDGWEPDELTETGKPSVNRAVLEGLDHEVASLVLRWRRVTKWSKSYVQPMIESGGHLHCNISSLRAATGRMAIDSPPLQQLPKGPEVRACLKADPDTEMWAIDFTGQEARLLAAYVGDAEFTDTVLNGGDIHGNIATALFGEDYRPEQRGWAKNAFYAYCYGAAQHRLALTAHAEPGQFEKAVAKAYPAIAGFMEDVIATGRRRLEEDGMAWARTAGGRMVAVPKSRIYALTNYIMQGGGADLVKAAILRVDEAGLAHTIRLVIHDELLVALPPGPEGAAQAEIIRSCMETTFRGVHFAAHSTGPGANWGDVA